MQVTGVLELRRNFREHQVFMNRRERQCDEIWIEYSARG